MLLNENQYNIMQETMFLNLDEAKYIGADAGSIFNNASSDREKELQSVKGELKHIIGMSDSELDDPKKVKRIFTYLYGLNLDLGLMSAGAMMLVNPVFALIGICINRVFKALAKKGEADAELARLKAVIPKLKAMRSSADSDRKKLIDKQIKRLEDIIEKYDK